jgi:hypothetical protein
MTLVISKGITLRKGYIGTDDPDAEAYIAAVEAADEAESPGVGALETATKVAIHSFVKGCKNDGIWPAIKASCILAGARTLAGALVPLVGTAPTNVGGFIVAGDYNRKTGIRGGTGGKILNSNRNNNADPQNSNHNAIYATVVNSNSPFMGTEVDAVGANAMFSGGTRNRNAGSVALLSASSSNSFTGTSRSNAASYVQRYNGVNNTVTQASEIPQNTNLTIFGYTLATPILSRLAFYSIGESLNLALLDARVTDLINAFAAAIP